MTRSRKRNYLFLGAAVLTLLILFMIIGFWGRTRQGYDPNAVNSSNKPLTAQELQEQIQKEADESSFRFKMNTAPVVKKQGGQLDAAQTADWCLVNSIDNSCNMVVVIKDSNGTELFKSKQLKPGEQELTGSLECPLEPGIYPATATASAIDPETGEVLNNITTDLTLDVQAESEEK